MTDTEINIAIAEACGHKDIALLFIADGTGMDQWVWCSGVIGRGGYEIPSYTTDLNAMHEAEKVLDDEQYNKFVYELYGVVTRTANRHTTRYYCATARQRAEAFLRTISKWNE